MMYYFGNIRMATIRSWPLGQVLWTRLIVFQITVKRQIIHEFIIN